MHSDFLRRASTDAVLNFAIINIDDDPATLPGTST
jgi:hypothetical protein